MERRTTSDAKRRPVGQRDAALMSTTAKQLNEGDSTPTPSPLPAAADLEPVETEQDRRLWQYRTERRIAALEARVERLEADLWHWRKQTRRRRWWFGGAR